MDVKDLAEKLRAGLACYGVESATVGNTLGTDVVTFRNYDGTAVVAVGITPKGFTVFFVYAKPMPTQDKVTFDADNDVLRYLRNYFKGRKDAPRGLVLKAEHINAIKSGASKITVNRIPKGLKEGEFLYARESWQWVDGVREAKHRKVEDRLGPVLPWIGNIAGDDVEWRVIYAADGGDVRGVKWLASTRMEAHSSRFLLQVTDVEYDNGVFNVSFDTVWRYDGLDVDPPGTECTHKDSVFNPHRMVYFCQDCRQEFDKID